MKKVLILLITFTFASELEVDGDLKVTGNIQNDSLAVVIANLQAQITALQTQVAQIECQNTGIIPEGYCDCFFHTLDECGVCNGDNSTCSDCAGVVGGTALEDMCGTCDSDLSNDCVQDCAGTWGGAAAEDVCGVCDGDTISEDDCLVYDGDGNGYHTIQIGNKIWMKENIRSLSNRACYDDDPVNCEIYGGLYEWDAAQSACPSGWHLALEEEYFELYSLYGGQESASSALMDDELWIGTNESQFSAVPAGYHHSIVGYANKDEVNFIWIGGTSSSTNVQFNASYNITHEDRGGGGGGHSFSVRCIQD